MYKEKTWRQWLSDLGWMGSTPNVRVSGLRPDERRLARHLAAVRTAWVAAPVDDVPDVDTPRSEYDGYLLPPNEYADYNDTNTDTSRAAILPFCQEKYRLLLERARTRLQASSIPPSSFDEAECLFAIAKLAVIGDLQLDVALLVLRRLDELSADTVTGRQMVTDRMLSSESTLDREARSSNGQTGTTVPPQWCTPEQRLSYYRAFASEPETSLRPQPAVVGASQRTDGSTASQQHEQFQLPEDIEAIEACIKGATPGDKIRAVWRERPAPNGVYVDTSPVIWSGVVTGAWDEPTGSRECTRCGRTGRRGLRA